MVLSTTSYCDPSNKFQWSAHERIRKWKTSLPGKCILAIIWNFCGNFYANCDGATIHLGIMWDPWLRCPGCSCPWDALRHCMECWWVGVPNADFMITSFRLLCEVAEVSFEMGWYCLLTKSGMPCFLQVTYWASWPSSMSATQWLTLCEFSLPCQLNLLSHEDRDFLKICNVFINPYTLVSLSCGTCLCSFQCGIIIAGIWGMLYFEELSGNALVTFWAADIVVLAGIFLLSITH